MLVKKTNNSSRYYTFVISFSVVQVVIIYPLYRKKLIDFRIKAFVSVFITLLQGLHFCFDTQFDTHMLKVNILCEFIRCILFGFFSNMGIDIHSCLYI